MLPLIFFVCCSIKNLILKTDTIWCFYSIVKKIWILRRCSKTYEFDFVLQNCFLFILLLFEFYASVWYSATETHLNLENMVKFLLPDLTIDIELLHPVYFNVFLHDNFLQCSCSTRMHELYIWKASNTYVVKK